MTGKDFVKVILCLYRYDKDITIETWRNDMEGLVYEIHATNSKTGDGYYMVSYGALVAVYDFLNYVENRRENWQDMILVDNLDSEDSKDEHYIDEPPTICPDWIRFNMKQILDDDFREKTIKQWKKDEETCKEMNEFFKEIDEWEKFSMPCRNGTCNEREWTDMSCVDHCVKNWNMSCPKLRQWHQDVKERRLKKLEEWNKTKRKV